MRSEPLIPPLAQERKGERATGGSLVLSCRFVWFWGYVGRWCTSQLPGSLGHGSQSWDLILSSDSANSGSD
jgi:hypothetical protein